MWEANSATESLMEKKKKWKGRNTGLRTLLQLCVLEEIKKKKPTSKKPTKKEIQTRPAHT